MTPMAIGSVAYLSALARNALICAPRGLVRLGVDGTLTHDVPERELDHLLQLFPDVEQVSAGCVPYADVLRRLRTSCKLDTVARLTLSMLDAEHGSELRARSAALLGQQLSSDPTLREPLLVRLLSLQLPEPVRRGFTAWAGHPLASVGSLFRGWSAGQRALEPAYQALRELLDEHSPGVQAEALEVIRRHQLVGWLLLSLALPFPEASRVGWAALDAVARTGSMALSEAWRARTVELLASAHAAPAAAALATQAPAAPAMGSELAHAPSRVDAAEDDEPIIAAFVEGRRAYPDIRHDIDSFRRDCARRGSGADSKHGLDLYLCSAWAAGDRVAREVLAGKATPVIQRVVSRYPYSDRRDVVAHILDRLFERHFAGYRGLRSLRGYVRQIALHILISERRAALNTSRPSAARGSSRALSPPPSDELQQALTSRTGAMSRIIRQAFTHVDDHQRLLLHHYFVQGLSLEALAGVHAVDRSTIARRVNRALASLRSTVAALLKDRPELDQWSATDDGLGSPLGARHRPPPAEHPRRLSRRQAAAAALERYATRNAERAALASLWREQRASNEAAASSGPGSVSPTSIPPRGDEKLRRGQGKSASKRR